MGRSSQGPLRLPWQHPQPKGAPEDRAATVGLTAQRGAGSFLGHLTHVFKTLDGARSLKQTVW